MPELPEVETVCQGLREQVLGRVMVSVNVRRRDLRRPVPEHFKVELQGKRVESISRRAKYALLHCEGGWIWLIHLGMSGRVRIYPQYRHIPEKHDHIICRLDNGVELALNDARRFGCVDLFQDEQLNTHPLLVHLGPEPLSKDFSIDYMFALCTTKQMPIKQFIMDQRYVVGVGNIYACESLFLARIHPERKACSLSSNEVIALVNAIKTVLTKAIQSGGSSLKDHVSISGELGYFQHQFNVYNQEGNICRNCDGIIQRIKQSGRSTFYCPECST